MPNTAIVWFRRDLRLQDNPALNAALDDGKQVIPIYLHGTDHSDPWAAGAASDCWLHHSLIQLSEDIAARGSRLIVRSSVDACGSLRALLKETSSDAIYWNRCYEPSAIERDRSIKRELSADGVGIRSFNSALIFEPWEIEKNSGGAFRVFTPFWKACLTAGLRSCDQPKPDSLAAVPDSIASDSIDSLGLLSSLGWDEGFYEPIQPGEDMAHDVLERFLDNDVEHYADERDIPSQDVTSRLSTYLHFGQISPRQVIASTTACKDAHPALTENVSAFERELGWREFAYHILYHFPTTTDAPMFEKFTGFPWLDDNPSLEAWQKGQTGIPLVDAGMRELWHTGTMHNRVRMVVASFLTKNLLIHWQRGAEWFRDTLIDYDLANNSMGWQWTAGCGADAAPYFRVFNPVSQSRKFDPRGAYLRHWVHEIRELPDRHVHAPWEAPDDIIEKSGVYAEKGYPKPIVELKQSRQRALDAYAKIRKP